MFLVCRFGSPVRHCLASWRSLHHGSKRQGSLPAVTEARHQSGCRVDAHRGEGSPCSGEVIGHGSVKSAAQMNSTVVLFVEKLEQANLVVDKRLSQPATNVTLPNVPLFITDDFFVCGAIQAWKNCLTNKKVQSGCSSPLLKHVASHRRQLYVILNNRREGLEVCLRVRANGYDCVLFVSSAVLKCFGCREVEDIIRMCPLQAETDNVAEKSGQGWI